MWRAKNLVRRKPNAFRWKYKKKMCREKGNIILSFERIHCQMEQQQGEREGASFAFRKILKYNMTMSLKQDKR